MSRKPNAADSFQKTENVFEGLTHTKISFRAWIAESAAFAKRWFFRLLILSFLLSFSFLGMCPRGMLPWDAICLTPELESSEPGTDWESIGPLTKDELRQLIVHDMETGKLPPPASSPSGPVRRPVFCLSFILISWLSVSWGLRTLREDNGTWNHLRFPSWKAVLNLILLLALCSALIPALFLCFCVLLGILNESAAEALVLLVLIFLLARIALSAHLILDRNVGVIRAVGGSWFFTRSNFGTLVVGGGFLFVLCYALLFALYLAFPPAFWTSACGRWCYFGGLLAVQTVLGVPALAMSSVFYLTVTGQKRLGTGAPKSASGISETDGLAYSVDAEMTDPGTEGAEPPAEEVRGEPSSE